ncbi:hypothetical protein MGAD_38440 [Mycolicibacterium gadium]|uniref:AAA+ ATPase domain-containing protein n=1 Tax=Mycolicibacterium gadium TaxID=1794 RepID=A0A7I7WPA0_MYCGU|nr:hypothetical protein MGAD_38440 [Mycolicibacterium gadium]
MTGVFSRLVGQHAVEAELIAAAQAARGDSAHSAAATGTMTHAWLITGPPGSGRSIAALCFAAALQCTGDGVPGCGQCRACSTAMAGTHADVRRIVPEGLSIGVDEMRAIVQIASRRPGTGRWQVVLIEDADRLTEGAANALLKVVEEPPPSTVFLLCAPSVDPEDIAITLRSRCRHVALVTPPVEAIAQVLISNDGLAEDDARWAASVSGGHVGRARRLAVDQEARDRRQRALGLARDAATPSRAYAAAEELVAAAEAEAVSLTVTAEPRPGARPRGRSPPRAPRDGAHDRCARSWRAEARACGARRRGRRAGHLRVRTEVSRERPTVSHARMVEAARRGATKHAQRPAPPARSRTLSVVAAVRRASCMAR